MKNNIKIGKFLFVIVIAIIVIASCTGCATNKVRETSDSSIVEDFVDPKTGVHYLLFERRYRGGITPRLNADGTIMVTPTEEQPRTEEE